RRDLLGEERGRLGGGRQRGGGDVAHDGEAGLGEARGRQVRCQALGGGAHQRAVEGRAHLQGDHAPAALLQQGAGALHAGGAARDDRLARRVEVGDLGDGARGRDLGEGGGDRLVVEL